MKSYILLILVFISIPSFAIDKNQVVISPNKQEIVDRFKSIETRFGQSLYLSLFCQSDIKPLAIFQNDKTMELYDNKWVSPETYLKKLDSNEQRQLVLKLIDLCDSMPNKNCRMLLMKLENWSMAFKQLNFIQDVYHVKFELMILALYKIEEFKPIFEKFPQRDIFSTQNLSNAEKEQCYYLVINQISEKNLNDHLKIMSKIYNELSNIAYSK